MKTIEAKNDGSFYAKYEQKLIRFYYDKYVSFYESYVLRELKYFSTARKRKEYARLATIASKLCTYKNSEAAINHILLTIQEKYSTKPALVDEFKILKKGTKSINF